jgi:hypothetical protein
MQLRSGKISAIKVTKKLDQGEIYYKSFRTIVESLQYNFSKVNALKFTSLERISLFRTIFQLIQTKIVEINYLKDDSRYASEKKLYLAIKDKIPQLIHSITDIMTVMVDLDDDKIEEITSLLGLLMKLRKQLK